MRKLVPLIIALSVSFPTFGAWPEALLPPGVRVENAPPGAMTFPVLLAELILPLDKLTDQTKLPELHLAFSPDSTLLAVAGQGEIRIIEIYRNKERWKQKAPEGLSGLCFSGDGSVLFAVGDNGKAFIEFSTETGAREGSEALFAKRLSLDASLYPVGSRSMIVLGRCLAGSEKMKAVKGIGSDAEPLASALQKTCKGMIPLDLDIRSSVCALLASGGTPSSGAEKPDIQAVIFRRQGKKMTSQIHKIPAPEQSVDELMHGRIALSGDGTTCAVAYRGCDPMALKVGESGITAEAIPTGGGRFGEAAAGSAEMVAFLGALPPRGETLAEGAPPNTLAVLNPVSRKKWMLQGTFTPGALEASDDGRWIVVLAEALPARGPRGQGLILIDNNMPGTGDKKIAYTYTSKAASGPLTMATDGSAVAFVEFVKVHKKTNGPALVLNVIR
jgi:hypothetical protein